MEAQLISTQEEVQKPSLYSRRELNAPAGLAWPREKKITAVWGIERVPTGPHS